MKTPHLSLFNRIVQRIRRAPRQHDAMLVLSMTIFNFTGGWSRTFAKEHYARF